MLSAGDSRKLPLDLRHMARYGRGMNTHLKLAESPKPRLGVWERVTQVVGIVIFSAVLVGVVAILLGLVVKAVVAVWS